MDDDFITIDGSLGEGGGSILRLSAGFSFLFNKPIKIINIRANRPKPGLRLQHLLGLKLLSELTGSTLSHCEVGTKELTFFPGNEIFKDNIDVRVSTAASIGLLVQPIQIASLRIHKPPQVKINIEGGGTFGKWAPSLNYLKHVTYPIFKKMGVEFQVNIKKYGFYPKGNGLTELCLFPGRNKLKPILLTELGSIDQIKGEIILTNLLKKTKPKIGEKIRNSIKNNLRKYINTDVDIIYKWVYSTSPGVGLSLWALTDSGALISTGTILGERHIPSEKLGIFSSEELMKYINNDIPVDEYLSDQLIPLMAYAKGSSKIKVKEVTSHAKTNLELIRKFTGREFKIQQFKKGYTIEYL